MERTIDRTSYRRSARNGTSMSYRSNENQFEVETKKYNRGFRIKNMILNQIIVSLLIIIGILIAQYFEIIDINEWVSKYISEGHSITELYSIIKNKFIKEDSNSFYLISSGDSSGEVMDKNDISGDNLSENQTSGDVQIDKISAVEGVNQMVDDANKVKENTNLIQPLKGIITSRFGTRESDNPIVSTYHAGIDIAANSGTEIRAAHGGKVVMAKQFSSYGNCVMIENDNMTTVYAHCSSINVKEGQDVNQGDTIAKVGMTGNATGPHLHFEIRYEGRYIDPELLLEF